MDLFATDSLVLQHCVHIDCARSRSRCERNVGRAAVASRLEIVLVVLMICVSSIQACHYGIGRWLCFDWPKYISLKVIGFALDDLCTSLILAKMTRRPPLLLDL